LIRQKITDETVTTGKPPELEMLAASMNISVADILAKVREEPPLERLAGLTSAQAYLLMNHYKDFEMFSAEVKATLTSFIVTREKIREIEKKSKK
jgi:hypothetical protein